MRERGKETGESDNCRNASSNRVAEAFKFK